MKRVICFCVAVGCCFCLLAGVASGLSQAMENVTFTQREVLGSPAVMEGRSVRFDLSCGEHMVWHNTLSWGEDLEAQTVFSFSQEGFDDPQYSWNRECDLYAISGGGFSSKGMKVRQSHSWAPMVQTVMESLGPGERGSQTFSLADYQAEQVLSLELSYASESVICKESYDFWWDLLYTEGEQSQTKPDSYDGLCQMFRFPLRGEEQITIEVQKDENGLIADLNFNLPDCGIVQIFTATNDQGAYLIPVYLDSDTMEPLPGDYAQGMGIYFVPWKEVAQDGSTKDGQAQTVTLDTSRGENIYPMADDALVLAFRASEDGSTAWMLSREGGWYTLTQVDLLEKRVCQRVELWKEDSDGVTLGARWYLREDRMVIQARETLVLVSLDGQAHVVFQVKLGEWESALYDLPEDSTGVWFDGELLILAGRQYYDDDGCLTVLAVDATGPKYWGKYDCDLFDGNTPGCSPWIQNGEEEVTIQ